MDRNEPRHRGCCLADFRFLRSSPRYRACGDRPRNWHENLHGPNVRFTYALCHAVPVNMSADLPRYQSELCDRTLRGRLVSAEVLFVGVGIVFAYWFDFGLSFAGGALAWRLPIAFQIIFAIFVVFLVFGLPESPRWLYSRGQTEEAIKVLCAVFNKEPEDEYIQSEINSIQEALAVEKQTEGEGSMFGRLFKKDLVRTRYRIMLAWIVQFMNQAGGINLVVYYAPCK